MVVSNPRKQHFTCPHCGKHTSTSVEESRITFLENKLIGLSVRRRRKCKICKATFSTVEVKVDALHELLAGYIPDEPPGTLPSTQSKGD